MTKQCGALMIAVLAWPVAAAAQDASAPLAPDMKGLGAVAEASSCKTPDAAEVVVCGRSQQKYRIDSSVLASARAVEALPPKPQLDADSANQCVGPNCGGGDYIPLISMAVTGVKAAVLAAQGDDWREAFRTHPDAYSAYQDAKQRKPHISVGLSASSK